MDDLYYSTFDFDFHNDPPVSTNYTGRTIETATKGILSLMTTHVTASFLINKCYLSVQSQASRKNPKVDLKVSSSLF